MERGRRRNVFLSFFASLSDFPSLRVFNLSPTLLSHPSISLPVKVFPILSGKLLVVSFSQNFPSWLTKFRIDGEGASNFIQPSNSSSPSFPIFTPEFPKNQNFPLSHRPIRISPGRAPPRHVHPPSTMPTGAGRETTLDFPSF